MKNSTSKFHIDDRMADLIRKDYRLLQVMSRFGISLGVTDKTVKQVCQEHNVDSQTFLTIANFMQEEDEYMHDNVNDLSLPSLLSYLKRAHSYFLDFCLPAIRHKLTEAIHIPDSGEVSILILKFFDEYVNEVREHMDFENIHEFKYVHALMNGDVDRAEAITHEACPMKQFITRNSTSEHTNIYKRGEHSNILLFTKQQAIQHKLIDRKLSELKNIIIKYYRSPNDNHLLNAVLFDIFICEEDLALHCRIEDCLFVPAVRLLEKEYGL